MIATTIELRVLSEEPIPESMDVADVIRRCDDDYVLGILQWDSVRITPDTMARYLIQAGSDPDFFSVESP